MSAVLQEPRIQAIPTQEDYLSWARPPERDACNLRKSRPMDPLAAQEGAVDNGVADFFHIATEYVPIDDHEVGVIAGRERAYRVPAEQLCGVTRPHGEGFFARNLLRGPDMRLAGARDRARQRKLDLPESALRPPIASTGDDEAVIQQAPQGNQPSGPGLLPAA